MKFIFWLFNAPRRHRREIRLYQKGLAGRIINGLIVPLVGAGATFGLTYLAFNQLGESLMWAVIAGVFAGGFLFLTIDYCGVFTYVAIKTLTGSAILSVAEKVANRLDANKTSEQPFAEIETTNEQPSVLANQTKNYKGVDILVAIFNVALTVGLIVGEIALILRLLKAL